MKLLTLNGWAQPFDGLSVIAPNAHHFAYSDYPDANACFEALAQEAEGVDGVIGWSLGGQLAVRGVLEGVLSPRFLVLIGASYQFAATPDFPTAMPPEMAAAFRESYVANTEKTVAKFNGLIAKGDKHLKTIMAHLNENATAADVARWLPWLEELARYSCHGRDLRRLPPTAILHGKEDAICRFPQALAFAEAIPHARLIAWEECGHAPHLHHPANAKALIAEMAGA